LGVDASAANAAASVAFSADLTAGLSLRDDSMGVRYDVE
jgi:hypothetical protein